MRHKRIVNLSLPQRLMLDIQPHLTRQIKNLLPMGWIPDGTTLVRHVRQTFHIRA